MHIYIYNIISAFYAGFILAPAEGWSPFRPPPDGGLRKISSSLFGKFFPDQKIVTQKKKKKKKECFL